MKFSDSHCHLDFPELHSQIDNILTRCLSLNIEKIVIPAVAPNNWQTCLNLAIENASLVKLYPCLGIHPWYLKGLTFEHLNKLEQLATAQAENIIAIGEAGIDGTIALQQDNLAKQTVFFDYQISLANTLNKPLIVHHRRSHNEITQHLKHTPVKHGGIIHAFSGSYQQGKTYINMGFKLGIGGTISYPRAKKTINAIKRFPLDALILETDAPAMPLEGEQGLNNSPTNTVKIFNYLAAIRTETKEELAQQLEHNFHSIFALNENPGD